MPRVPVYNAPQQQTRAAPNVFQSARGATPEAFGGSIGRALEQGGHDMGRAADLMYKRQLEIKREDDEAAALNAYVKASEATRGLLHDPERGIYSRRGAQAFGSLEEAQAQFKTIGDEITAGLANDDQRRAFENLWIRRRESELTSIARHVAGERRTYQDATVTALADSAVKDAAANYTDPAKIRSALAAAETAIRANPAGLPPDEVDRRLREVRSKAHAAVVERMGVENATSALAYLREHREEIDGTEQLRLEKALEGGVKKEQARGIAKAITSGASTDIARKVVQQAQAQGVDPHVALTTMHLESGGDPDARNPNSTADGLFQMIDSTWAARGGTAADRRNVDKQIELGVKNIAEDTKAAEKALGRKLEPWEQYLIHQQGARVGVRLLRAGRGEKATDVVGGEAQVTLNGGEKSDTVDDFLGKLKARYERAAAAVKLPAAGDTTRDRAIASDRSLAQQLEAAKAIPDDEVREMTITHILQENARTRAAAEAEERANREDAWNRLDADPSLDAIPPSLWGSLTLRDQEIIKSYLDRRARGDDQTDLPTYDRLNRLAGSTPEEFAKVDLLQYRDKLSRSDWQRFSDLQRSILAADTKASEKVTSIRNANQMVDDALRTMKIDPSPKEGSKDADRAALFRRRVQEEVDALEASEQRKAKPAEIQEIIDRLAVKGFVPGTGWFGSDTGANRRFAFELRPGQEIRVDDVDDVPVPERDKIEAALKRAGKPVTDDAVLDLFNLKLQQQRRAQ